MILKSALVSVVVLAGACSARAEGITGRWQAENGKIVRIGRCGGAFCATVASGKYSGQRIGRFTRSDGKYVGSITDPKTRRHYSGTATLKGSSLRVQGCALKIFCKSQLWTKQ